MTVSWTPPRMRPWMIAAVAAVLAMAIVTTGLWRDESESAGGPVTPIRQADEDAPEVLWVGDSYTIGYGTEGPAGGYACLASDTLGWTCELDAQSGTGFINAGRPDTGYAPLGERLARTNEVFGPDMVVIDAGRNDHAAKMPAFRQEVTSYLDRANEAFPDARFVIVLPFLLGDTNTRLDTVNGILRQAARSIDAAIIDTTTPAWARMVHRLPTVDAIHPTGASHAAIARRLAGDFRRLQLVDAR